MENIWLDVADRVKDLSSKPEKFLEPTDTIFNKTKILAKVLYDAAKLLEDGKYRNVTLPELIIDNFDEEQVWAGVELQNTAWESDFRDQLEKLETLSIRNPDSFNLLRGPTARVLKSKPVEEVESEEEDDDIVFDDDDVGDEEEEEHLGQELEVEDDDDDLSDIEDGRVENGDNDEGDSDEDPEMKAILNDPDFQHMSDSDGDELPLFGEKDSSDDDEPDIEEEEEKEMKKQEEKEKKNKILAKQADAYLKDALKTIKTTAKGERAQVEDQFFKLDEMEKFLEAEEARERQDIKLELKGKKNKDVEEDSDDEDDDELDLFDSRLVTEGKEDRAMYKDYFNKEDDPEEDLDDGDDGDEEEDEPAAGPPAKRMLLDPASSDEEDKDMGEIKSSFEVRTAKLKKEIKKMEEEAISDKKPWQMIGEVSAVTRPENSLLQEHLDYDNVAKQAPIVTEEVSRRLEDIIMQRIKDRAWDDVERKIRPVENPYEYKKKLILDQEKSKLSLAEVYEQEYLKQKGDLENAKKVPGMLDPEEDGPPPEVDSIKRSMKSLFAKLDTLTHFHYTPRMASAEVKIVRNAPAITMEEVAPIAMNDANLLAPQEIVDKKRSEEIGSTEKTETDKKRERRQKKQKQRLREKEKEKKEKLLEKLKPGLGNKHSKKKVLKDIEKAEKEGKLVTIKSKSKSVKSSSAFFNQLQNETMSTLKEKMSQTPKKKKAEKGLSGALLKL